MSTKTLIGIVLIFLFLVAGIFLGWNIKPIEHCPEPVDTLKIKGNIEYLLSDTVFTVKWKDLPVETDTINEEVIKSSSIDSTFAHNEDAIRVEAKVKYNTVTDLFEWLLDIEHKDFASHQTDTLKIYMTEVKEIEFDNPIWIGSTIASVILLLLAIIF